MKPTGATVDNIFQLAEKQQKLIEQMVAEKRDLATQMQEFAEMAKKANGMLTELAAERERLRETLRQVGLKLHKLSGPDSGAVGYYLREIRDEILAALNEVEG